jgi:hypothetical protein
MKRAARSFTVLIAALIILGSPAFGQDPPPQEPAPAGGGGQRGAAQSRPPRPYEQVITRDAKTDKGVFENDAWKGFPLGYSDSEEHARGWIWRIRRW